MEKFVKSYQVKLFLVGLSYLEPLCATPPPVPVAAALPQQNANDDDTRANIGPSGTHTGENSKETVFTLGSLVLLSCFAANAT